MHTFWWLTSLLLLSCVSADYSFGSDITITNDPQVPNGVMHGHMNYFYNTTGSNHLMTIDYTYPTSMTETWVYQKNLHYRYCSSCYTETYKLPPDKYFRLTTDQFTGRISNQCLEYTRIGDTITNLWINPNTSQVCRVLTNTGKTIWFNHTQAVNWSQLYRYKYQTCTEPVCNRIMDIVLVFDESGSIDSNGWTSEINFATSLIEKFNIDPKWTTMGVVFFSTNARLITKLSGSKQSIINAVQTAKRGGSTCIGCGMSMGLDLFKQPVSGRSSLNPVKSMIVLTDGENNEPGNDYKALTNLTNSANNVHNAGITTFAIGVGTSVSQKELNLIATTLPTGKAVINVNDFSSLDQIINSLVTVTCTDISPQPCGLTCYGFCSCNQTCMCPECQDLGKCVNNQCTMINGQTRGCIPALIDCDDHNACTLDTCQNDTGCIHTPIVWSDGNICTDDLCNNISGPYTIPHSCDDHNLCTADSCTSSGCVNTDLCDDHNNCTIDVCDPLQGCSHIHVDCDDHNLCTNDFCDSVTGCYSTTITCPSSTCYQLDGCYPTLGCKYSPIDCEDGNICTDNTCDPVLGCQNRSIPCSACLAQSVVCPHVPCHDVKCIDNDLGQPVCQYTNWTTFTTGKCNSHNLCVFDECDILTEQCSSKPKTCRPIPCKTTQCDTTTGQCVYTDVNCSTGDPCSIGYCDSISNSCKQNATCGHRKCYTEVCTNGTCGYTKVVCDSGSQCMIGRCNDKTDQCEYYPKLCDDHQMCTVDTCLPDRGCVYTTLDCDDHDPCTNDTCDNRTGCVHVPKCNDHLYCTDDLCLSDGQCVYPPIQCTINLTDCSVAACSERRKCHRQVASTAFIDVCGNCINTFNTNSSVWNTTGAKTKCVSGMSWPKLITGLTAAAVAGIIIAAIIGAIIATTSGVYGTKELIKRSKLAANQSAHVNPLYESSGHEMTNPTYFEHN